jgi:hypothetical protein
MPDPRPDPDERFSLWPLDPEEGLRRLLDPDADDPPGEDEDS